MFRLAARLWIVVFAVVLALGALAFSSARIHTDIRALLPGAQEETVGAAQILAHAAEISRDVWVLVGLPSGEEAERAARLMQEAAARRGLSLASPADTFDAGSLARALTPWRDAFLTAEDKAFLEKADDKALLHRALSLLYRPLSIGVLPFEDIRSEPFRTPFFPAPATRPWTLRAAAPRSKSASTAFPGAL